MRQPFRLTATLGAASKSILKSAAPVRSFHSTPKANANFFTSKSTPRVTIITKARNGFKQSRTYMQQPVVPANQNASLLQKLAVGGAMVAGKLNLSSNFKTIKLTLDAQ